MVTVKFIIILCLLELFSKLIKYINMTCCLISSRKYRKSFSRQTFNPSLADENQISHHNIHTFLIEYCSKLTRIGRFRVAQASLTRQG